VTTLHPFEASGLGLAPFRLLSIVASGLRGCAHCGTGIKVHCHIQSADGRRFIVGSDCVRKVAEKVDTTLALAVRRELNRIACEKREAKREQRWQALKARMDAAKAELAADADLFTAEPHPHPYFERQGLKLRDFIEWQLAHGGDRARAAACKAIETICAPSHV
jgi:hypothetical protein